MKLKVKIDNKFKIQFLFVFFWIHNSIISSAISFGGRVIGLSENSELILKNIVVVAALIFALSAIIKYIKARQIMMYLLVVAIYFCSYLLFPENADVMNERMVPFLLGTLPLFFLGCMVEEIGFPYTRLLWMSRAIIVLMLLVYLFYNQGGSEFDHEMGRAYVVLPSVMLVSHRAMKGRKIADILFMLMGVTFLFICATRGPILMYALFMMAQVFFVAKKYRALYIIAFALILIVILTPLGVDIIAFLLKRFSSSGFNVRIFEMILAGDLANSNGRNYLSEVVLEMAGQHPFIGNGILSDRRATSFLAWVGGTGIYAHNIIYEFWCDFGYVIGTFLLAALVFGIIKTYLKPCTDESFKVVFLIMVLSYVGKLVFSSSFIEEPGFWLCVGICYESMKKAKALTPQMRKG